MDIISRKEGHSEQVRTKPGEQLRSRPTMDKMFICFNNMYRGSKMQLPDGNERQDMNGLIAFDKSKSGLNS